MQKAILWVLAVVIVAGGWFLYSSKAGAPTFSENAETPAQEAADADTGAPTGGESPAVQSANLNPDAVETAPAGIPTEVITYTDAGFVPSSVTVKKGQIVRWMNNSGSKVWPASAVHPSHEVYPQKSPSDCLGSSFDACKGLAQGESWDFKFDVVGEWKFHNHLNASQRGAVKVTE